MENECRAIAIAIAIEYRCTAISISISDGFRFWFYESIECSICECIFGPIKFDTFVSNSSCSSNGKPHEIGSFRLLLFLFTVRFSRAIFFHCIFDVPHVIVYLHICAMMALNGTIVCANQCNQIQVCVRVLLHKMTWQIYESFVYKIICMQ